jgi:eukaryotic-like serine/threonine-protein kinase
MNRTERVTESTAEMTASATLRQDDAALMRAAALSAPRQAPPAEIPGYDIQRCLGTGAYGSVWLAQECNTGKQVAIKFYSHHRGLDWGLLNREVEKLAMLYTSRDIVGLMQVGWDSDPPFYVMEYLQNGSLSHQLEDGPLPVAETVRIITTVCGALVHAHQHGILHCDIKPANVLLDGHFAPRLADFGQSRLSHEQSPALGTLYYMAPEQANLSAVPDARWDVYALGALLYHMLCGESPHRSPENEQKIAAAGSLEEKLAVYRQIVERGPRPAKHRAKRGVDSRLADIVDRCLSPNPVKRYRDAAEVAQALASRARYRSLRPAIALGIIVPGILLLALFPIALKAAQNAALTAEKNIAERALESDLVAAKILAYSLKDELVMRKQTLENIANHAELRDLLAGLDYPEKSTEREKLNQWLHESKQEIDTLRREQNAEPDDSWFLTDAKGFQRWRDPPSEDSIGKNYAWRDYFHGQRADREDWKTRTDIPPLRSAHVSAPFRSTTDGSMKVAITVPVWREAEKKTIVGVLGRTVRLGSLLTTYENLIIKNTDEDKQDQNNERVIALIDTYSGKVLDHPWLTNNSEKLLDDAIYEKLSIGDVNRENLAELIRRTRENARLEEIHLDKKYSDPIGEIDESSRERFGMDWLAAFWPVGDPAGDYDWVAVVQERRDEALLPVREIEMGLMKYALAGLVLCITLTATSWYLVRRVMRPRSYSRLNKARNGSSAGSRSGSMTGGSLSGSSVTGGSA